jgi:GTP-binding protein YchF
LEIGIVGLPRSGKTTIFNAVTRGTAQVAGYGSGQRKPNIGIAKVQDPRLDALAAVFTPKRLIPAEVTYVDIPAAPDGLGNTRGISGEYLNHLQTTDALLVVTRAFEDPSVPHVSDSIDPLRDLETMLYELAFADLDILDRRLVRIAQGSKGAKAPEREAMLKERALIERLKKGLEAGTAIRDQHLGHDEVRSLEGFQFLSAKPLMVVANVAESQLSDAASLESQVASAVEGPRIRAVVLCGKLEMELAQMDPPEEREFRDSLGLGESGLDKMIALSHAVMDQVTFFTGNANEVRAWTVDRGTAASNAAGKIHSDFKRGFIRSEVVGFDDLTQCGSVAHARSRGLLRQEGRTYVVREGDVMNVLFNV